MVSVEMGSEMGYWKGMWDFEVTELWVWVKVDMWYLNTHFWMQSG